MIFSLVTGLLTIYGCWTWLCLEFNVRRARALGLPVVRTPFDVNGHLWVVVQPFVWKLFAVVPIPWSAYPDIVRFSHRNWNYLEKSNPIQRFGPVWALACPGGVHIYVADPDAIEDIFSRWKDFVRPVHKYEVLSIYGPSLFNAPIEQWPRHRKAVAAPFNESIMKFVWQETLQQTRAMLNYWTSQSAAGIPDLQRDTRTVTLNVLASTVFRETYDFVGSANLKLTNLSTAESFRDALLVVHHYIIHLMVIPYRYLIGPLVPQRLSRIGLAALNLKQIMTKVVTKEKAAIKDGSPGSGGLVTSLVRAIDHTSKRGVLSLKETLGNIFMINFAGLDTTANVLAFMIMRVAGEPEIQDWLREEIMAVTKGRPVQEWEYELFSELRRCYAVFLETLRLYAPVTGLPKTTARGVQSVQIGERTIAIPPGTDVFPMLLGVQTDPRYWDNPFNWKPKRWIACEEGSSGVFGEALMVPRKGTFFPWAEGPQSCLGKKVSQVESVAVLAALLVIHRMRVKSKPGETEDEVRKRVEDCCDDNNFNILLEMNNPAQVGLECFEI
ncbi:putative cytochrome P450 [Polyplosphaeria fusca]|uniref:Cytochrome P450 n=1 Tax=Polyplosphaeria fusca TaxID=682080 RepID=A0A9P4QR25_9PLEO|nr:putative cytochrome P450 [Polyplosphaeria fusca]